MWGLMACTAMAQEVLTLDSCRTLAMANNKELLISREKMEAAHHQRKAAFANYLPAIDATGAYIRTQKEISLLSDEQKESVTKLLEKIEDDEDVQNVFTTADFSDEVEAALGDDE